MPRDLDTGFLGDYMPEPPSWMDEIPPPEEDEDMPEEEEEKHPEAPTYVEGEEPEDDIPF